MILYGVESFYLLWNHFMQWNSIRTILESDSIILPGNIDNYRIKLNYEVSFRHGPKNIDVSIFTRRIGRSVTSQKVYLFANFCKFLSGFQKLIYERAGLLKFDSIFIQNYKKTGLYCQAFFQIIPRLRILFLITVFWIAEMKTTNTLENCS